MSHPSIIMTHVAFGCRNLAAQEAFYSRHFGFKRSRTFHRGEPGEFFLLKVGAMRLELFPLNPEKQIPADAKGGEQAVGYRHMAFEVPKLEPMVEALKADGIQPDAIIELPQIAPGFRIVFFRDPEGNIVELMEGYIDEA